MYNRRVFLKGTTAAALSTISGTCLVSAAQPQQPTAWPIAIFEKVFEALTYDELARAIAEIGADGVEATIRPGGHISPETAAVEVPKMAEAMQKVGKRIAIAATSIGGVDEPTHPRFTQDA